MCSPRSSSMPTAVHSVADWQLMPRSSVSPVVVGVAARVQLVPFDVRRMNARFAPGDGSTPPTAVHVIPEQLTSLRKLSLFLGLGFGLSTCIHVRASSVRSTSVRAFSASTGVLKYKPTAVQALVVSQSTDNR